MADFFVDSLGTGYSEDPGGSWGNLNTGGYGGNSRYSIGLNNVDIANFAFSGLTAGASTVVGATWPEQSNLYTASKWKVYDSDGTTLLASASLDQTQDPASLSGGFTDAGFPWAPIGTVTPSGTTLTVKLVGDGNAYIVADAAIAQQTAAAGLKYPQLERGTRGVLRGSFQGSL